jgi:hypothetical protein
VTVQPVIDVVPLLVTLKVPVNPVPHTFSEYAAVHPAAALAAGDEPTTAAPAPAALRKSAARTDTSLLGRCGRVIVR